MKGKDIRTIGFAAALVGLYRLLRGRWVGKKKEKTKKHKRGTKYTWRKDRGTKG